MKIYSSIFYLLFAFYSFGQNDFSKTVYHTMDTVASSFLKESGAYSVSIAVVKNGETYMRQYGEIDKGKGNKPKDNSYFEIASVTKTFVGVLMAKAVIDNKINLSDDVRKYLEGNYQNLEYKGQAITIKDLLLHRTGISRGFPDVREVFKNADDSIPFKILGVQAQYSKKKFFDELSKVKLDTFPGAAYYYSELGPQLSAHILEKVYNKSFETLLRGEIFEKTGMTSTRFHLTKSEKLSNGYNDKNVLMPFYDDHLWGAAGFLKSTPSDLVKYLKFHLDEGNKVVLESHNILREIRNDAYWKGYFWEIHKNTEGNYTYFQHGGLFGTQNVFFVIPKNNFGVSIIANQSSPKTGEYLGSALEKLKNILELK